MKEPDTEREAPPPGTDITPSITKRRSGPRMPTLGHGRYRMLERLGQGGMGEVFAARDNVIGREIAIKRMLENEPSSEQIERFLREARIQGALDHPAIPPVHELAEDEDGRPYLVMKRLVGTTLAEILSRIANRDADAIRRYPRERLLRAFAEACLAVELAHIRGVVHRDLKPANIMLGDFGEVFVLDWGVAAVVANFDTDLAALRDPRPTLEIVGTTPYMAPEQHAGAVVDGRTDVYALGRMLHEILTGRRYEPTELVLGDEVPPELAGLCHAATAGDHRKRPTARELGEAVQRYLDGDRDAALRRRLAHEHLARARTASTQRTAMHEAGRALALDPALPGVAELVGRLMLEPPSVTPPEVEASLDAAHDRAAIAQARLSLGAYLAYALFIPFLVWLGLHTSAYLTTLIIGVAALSLLSWFATRDPMPRSPFAPRLVLAIAGNAAVVVVMARLFSPFLIAPGIASLTIAVMLGSPAYRRTGTVALMVVAMSLAIVLPWVAELAGLASRTVVFEPGLRVVSSELHPDPTAIWVGLLAFALMMVGLTTVITLRRARLDEAAQRQLHLQAWRLEQLVPAPRCRS